MVTGEGMPTSDAAVLEATGRTWDDWHAWLDEHHASDLDHEAIVQLLDEHAGVGSASWCQSVTVDFERHIGRQAEDISSDRALDVCVQRTFRSTAARAWSMLASRDGSAAWLGDTPDAWWHGELDGPARGEVLTTPGGERYEVRGAAIGRHLRLRTLGPGLPPTTIQLTVTPERGRTIIGLSQEGLLDELSRERFHEQWRRALDRIGDLLDDA